MSNDEFRASQAERRAAGLKARHETREARAIRRQVADEIAGVAESWRHTEADQFGRQHCAVCTVLAELAVKAREIGSSEASA